MGGVYPRVCGGTGSTSGAHGGKSGLSPRVRGNLCRLMQDLARLGSIPACAGEPFVGLFPCASEWVYPRVCGGTRTSGSLMPGRYGLSPRVRGNLPVVLQPAICQGSIPACAGEPQCLRTKPEYRRVYPRVCGGTSVKYLTKVRLSSVFSCQ